MAGPVVVGEAVAVALRPARLGARLPAALLDLLLASIAVTVVLNVGGLVLFASGVVTNPTVIGSLAVIGLYGSLVGYDVLTQVPTRGRSPGGAALGLRVVRDDGGPVTLRQVLVRSLTFWLVEATTLFLVPVLLLALTSSGKRLGDLLAGTVVLQERVPRVLEVDVVLPPPLVAWAANADLSGVDDALALRCRQVLQRAPRLHEDARERFLVDTANRVLAGSSPRPPADAPAWALLAAVVAERRRRATPRGWARV